MKVLYFHQHFATRNGKGGIRSYEMARAMAAKGWQVTVVCGNHENAGLDGDTLGFEVVALPLEYSNRHGILRRSWLFLRFSIAGAKLALNDDCDILLASSTPLTAAIPGIASKLARRRAKFVFEVRDLWPELPRALGMRNPVLLGGMSLLERLAYRTADACVGLAPGIVDGIRRRAPKDRIVEFIPNGCDLDIFMPSKRRPLRLEGIATGDFVAGFIGAHGRANGLDAVLDAAAALLRQGRRNIKLLLIGDGGCKSALEKRARNENLSNVVFHGPVDKSQVSEMTASFGCGLMILANIPAFYYGTSPNKFFDYVSAGVPVLCNYPGWMADLVDKNRCGIGVPPNDPAAFAAALIRLADSPAETARMGARARSMAQAQFDRRALAEQMIRFLESVAA